MKPPAKAIAIAEKMNREVATERNWKYKIKKMIISESGITMLNRFSAQAKERINGEWVELNSDNIEKLNYNLSVGAGYSMLFNKGWELQINPTLTYFMKNVKNEELPYSFNQQSVGLQLMLLKKLGTP